MATVVVMPQLGNSVESCLIVSWQVQVGDEIAENAIVCEVETDKASMEVPSSTAGTVLALLWEEGDDVPVKDPLLVVGSPGEDPQPALEAAGWKGKDGEGSPAVLEGETGYEETGAQQASGGERVETTDVGDLTGASPAPSTVTPGSAPSGVSPRARNLAQAQSLDPATLAEGTGPGGRVIERDVQTALTDATRGAARAGAHEGEAQGTGLGGRVTTADLAKPVQQPAEAAGAPAASFYVERDYPGTTTQKPLKGIRKVISERMMNSLATSAQLTYQSTAAAGALLALRKRLKNSPEELGLGGVTIGDLVGFAAVKTAAKHTNHNSHLEGASITQFDVVHLGVAVDTPRGLLVPTIRNASQMSLREFSAVSKDLAHQAIAGNINPDLLSGATFTVSNLGGFGMELFTPLLNVPQVAILGVNAITPRATVRADGSFGVEQRIGLSLTADHRAVDGADSARFLQDLVRYIENIDITALG